MGTIKTISDLQKVFGDKPLNSIQPTLIPKSKYPNLKTTLIVGGVVLSVVGLFTVFSKIKDMMDRASREE